MTHGGVAVTRGGDAVTHGGDAVTRGGDAWWLRGGRAAVTHGEMVVRVPGPVAMSRSVVLVVAHRVAVAVMFRDRGPGMTLRAGDKSRRKSLRQRMCS